MSSVAVSGDRVGVTTADGGAAVPDVVSVLNQNGIPITDLSVASPPWTTSS